MKKYIKNCDVETSFLKKDIAKQDKVFDKILKENDMLKSNVTVMTNTTKMLTLGVRNKEINYYELQFNTKLVLKN